MTGYDFLKFGATGIAAPDMTAYDKMRALAMAGAKYPVATITGVPPIRFKSDGSPLISWSMLGNTQQDGTPSPDNIIIPTFCGKLVSTDWTIPITCAGQTTPVYLGEVPKVRRIKKLVLTGEEDWLPYTQNPTDWLFYMTLNSQNKAASTIALCTHAPYSDKLPQGTEARVRISNFLTSVLLNLGEVIGEKSTENFKSYLAQQYAAGKPVMIWYALAETETAIVNEPLCKIGTYADELSSTDAAITIPTVKGQNTLTVDTDLQPSSVSITGHIKPST